MTAVLRVLAALVLAAAIIVAPMHAPSASAFTSTRYAGADRFATSVEVSKWSSSWAGTTVFLASGLKFPDALAAGPVAAAERGHLLLTRPDRLEQSVLERMRDLNPAEVVIVGSESSVSAAVAAQVERETSATITRIGGSDRVETSLLLLDRLLETVPDLSTVWVASGKNFPDALVAASVAGANRQAVVLDYHDGSSSGVDSWIQRVRPAIEGRVVNIAGGGPSVSAYDEQVLRWSGTAEVFRYAGANRYETAQKINDTFNASPADRTMLLATGENFPDALSGAVLAALRGIPLYLTPKACHAEISQMLRDEANERSIGSVIGLGSASSISDRALSLGPCPTPTPPTTYTALQNEMGQRYGMFVPRQFSGTGGQVIDLGSEVYAGQITATHAGSSEFAVTALAADFSEITEPIWSWGRYDGTAILDGTWSYGDEYMTRYLQVTADGPWFLRLDDLRRVPEFSGAASGTGDRAYLYGGASAVLRAQHTGDSYFSVHHRWFDPEWEYQEYLINSSGAYSGNVPLQAGRGWIQVSADGAWSLSLGSVTQDAPTASETTERHPAISVD